MIIDVHTHVGTAAEHITAEFQHDLDCCWPGKLFDVDVEHHRETMASVDAAIVLAFEAPASGMVVPNEYVADIVAQGANLIGFASVDPTLPRAIERLDHAVHELGLKGLKLGPTYQNFDPTSGEGMALFARAERLGIPVLCHQGTTFVRRAKLKYAKPILLDEVAQAFPELRLCIAHLGHPWIPEAMAVIRKHPYLTADISAVTHRPKQLYDALRTAVEYGVEDKLLFGSDYPFSTPAETMANLRNVNSIVAGTGLPPIPDSTIEEIIHRDAFASLGIS